MKLLQLRGALALILMQFSLSSHGQTVTQELTSDEIANRISYAYGADYLTNNPTLVTAFSEVMTDRIEYRVSVQDQNEKYPLLSSYPVYNKVNPSITGANFENFNVHQFNPLMYNLEFFSNKTQIIRIDNTDYIMIIHSTSRN